MADSRNAKAQSLKDATLDGDREAGNGSTGTDTNEGM